MFFGTFSRDLAFCPHFFNSFAMVCSASESFSRRCYESFYYYFFFETVAFVVAILTEGLNVRTVDLDSCFVDRWQTVNSDRKVGETPQDFKDTKGGRRHLEHIGAPHRVVESPSTTVQTQTSEIK